MRAEELNYLRRFADTCDASVIRKGQDEPCEKLAVGAIQQFGDTLPWPACAYHLNQYHADAVALLDLIGGKP
jgi:hypothetical protein